MANTDKALQLRFHFPDLNLDFGLLMKPDDNIHRVIRKLLRELGPEKLLTVKPK